MVTVFYGAILLLKQARYRSLVKDNQPISVRSGNLVMISLSLGLRPYLFTGNDGFARVSVNEM